MEELIEKRISRERLSSSDGPSERLRRAIPAAFREVLAVIVKLITPEKIFLSGTYANHPAEEKPVYDLLIMIPGGANRPYSDYDVIVKQVSTSIYPVTAIILKRNELFKKLTEGHVYFSRVCRLENLVYDDGAHPLPVAERIPVDDITARSEKDFQYGQDRARWFLRGARYYSGQQQKELAAFMLHQAMEQICRGFLKGLTGREVASHDLCSLMRRCRRCAPGFIGVFHEQDADERRLFFLLQRAYIHTRYKNNYAVNEDDLKVLTRKTTRLYLTAEKVFHIKIGEAARALRRL